MTITPQSLFALLPGILRIRDAEDGGQLEALVAILAEQATVLERDISGLYDNLFIETCDEWVVPYIADLIGVRGLPSLGSESGYSARADVADTLANRRRKGTVSALETVARDASGWPAHAVEYFSLLGWTQDLNHVRLENARTYDLRNASNLELVGGPFDPTARTADVRSIALGRGRYNIMNIGIFLWRLQSYWFNETAAHPAPGTADGRYFFLPDAVNVPLFNPVLAGAESALSDPGKLVTEFDVPGHLRRLPLYDELEGRRRAIVDGTNAPPLWFDSAAPVVRIYTQASAGVQFVEIPPERIEIADLSAPPNGPWRRPSAQVYTPANGDPAFTVDVAVDPMLGRISFATGVVPNAVRTGFAYGFSADMGGGPYNRPVARARITRTVDWQMAVSKNQLSNGPANHRTSIGDAIADWANLPGGVGRVGVIVIDDSDIYTENLTITVPPQCELHIVAASWKPQVLNTIATYYAGEFEPTGRRPYLVGNVTVTGSPGSPGTPAGVLWLDGMWIDGKITVTGAPGDDLGTLGLSHVALFPSGGGLEVVNANPRLSVEIVRSLVGGIAITGATPDLVIEESIVEATGGAAIAAPNVWASIQRCTVFGTMNVQRLEAGNSIFTDLVSAARRQSGCMRYCYVLPASATPRRFRCQPDLAIAPVDISQKDSAAARIGPSFTSRSFASAAYGQLSATTSPEIMTGAEDESEMGAFGFLMQPQRAAAARAAIDEYLRAGLEAGLFYVT